MASLIHEIVTLDNDYVEPHGKTFTQAYLSFSVTERQISPRLSKFQHSTSLITATLW